MKRCYRRRWVKAPQAFQHCTDGYSGYDALDHRGGWHLVALGKSQTYSVEAGHAELQHSLARLG